MRKAKYKTIINNNGTPELKEVNGYYTSIKDEKVFIYKSFEYRRWYVIDVNTGLSIADGYTMRESKFKATTIIETFKLFKASKKYLKAKSRYSNMVEVELKWT